MRGGASVGPGRILIGAAPRPDLPPRAPRLRTGGPTAGRSAAVRDRRGRQANPQDDHPESQGDQTLPEEAIIVKDQLNTDEREILKKFERGELGPASEAGREMEIAHQAARNTERPAGSGGRWRFRPSAPAR